MILIETERLSIIPADYKTNHDILENRKEIEKRYQVELLPQWPEDKAVYVTFSNLLYDDSSLYQWLNWLVVDKQENKVIGDVAFKGKPKKGCCEICYYIVGDYRNKGYATEAVNALIDFAFKQNVEKIKAETLSDNLASMQVLKKCGFKKIRTNIIDNNRVVLWCKKSF